ncbi:PSD1 and planctomycete cytochrome C domain-containing protein [Blastopirellula sp. JC732]|uniref:PSD1 and planctomycete cytochrome C domain-containing protein n=1 Tax=Blastopirellula sediminis TaxID=2894196 RepID=A0A9X1SFV3_9BACT|nr:PSD1 and planctomycete cytochrome C domain-containing protein [Blastopirellula sediminis]MCC9608485.1 PSD1 and planctomycete cytochrome C domain-containing protein [Blastopirellula sediminis]MCC9628738.1 PSD1 and planctomycete cytochrome C domain-containing protein [Blastopirellula sediminis]
MNPVKVFSWSLLLLCMSFGDVVSADEGDDFFEKRIRPILVKHCYDCHAGVNSEGGLLLDTRDGWRHGGDNGTAIVPGQPDDSLLIQAIRYEDAESLAMPPKEAGGKLSGEEIAALEEWVRRGAPDPRIAAVKLGGMTAEEAKAWWAFQPLPNADPAPTATKIDAYLDQKLAEQGLTSAPPADKRTLLRRATYDLTGLPPTSEEVDAFLADESPDAFAKVIDRLLASPQYGVRYGRHWLDVVRYADTAGENTDRPLPHAWRYRNWVIDALNQDKPFDQFVRLQLAGDLIGAKQPRDQTNEGIIATGYLAIARRFGHDIDEQNYLMHEDVIDNLGKNFLGLTTGCARCHNHKYDPITVDDYYALYGVFESTRFAFPGCEPKGQPRDLISLASPEQIDALMQPWNEKVAAADTKKKQLEQTAAALLGFRTENARPLVDKTLVAEGTSVPFANLTATVRKGEVLQLTVFPNESHGADSTRVEWTIKEEGEAGRTWNVDNLIDKISQGNPLADHDEATWCFLETTTGPISLSQRYDSLQNNPALKAWKRFDDALSIFVNTSDQPVDVWTTLPAKAFFVHPEHNRPVTVAWISPIDGAVTISGAVADAHPSGSDGVAFDLVQIAAPQYGAGLIEMGKEAAAPAIDPGPKPKLPVAYSVIDAKPTNAKIQKRGDPEQPGDEVERHWLTVFGGTSIANPQESGRRELADLVAQHPLTARVFVNRVWQWHFGQGLVGTPNNFGSRGQLPTHPELLDWLTAEFVASGYQVKTLHRLILQTAAYQRSSDPPTGSLDADPENHLLSHYNLRRLSAEEIRDSLLFVSGQLDLAPAQEHPFPDESTWTFTQHTPFNAIYETNKRSAYLMVQRQHRHPFLSLFDGADPNASTPARETSTVPTQSLYFLNDPFFHAQAAATADRLSNEENDDQRLQIAYRLLFQRQPTASETKAASAFLQNYPAEASEKWRAYVRVLLAGNEFLHVD